MEINSVDGAGVLNCYNNAAVTKGNYYWPQSLATPPQVMTMPWCKGRAITRKKCTVRTPRSPEGQESTKLPQGESVT